MDMNVIFHVCRENRLVEETLRDYKWDLRGHSSECAQSNIAFKIAGFQTGNNIYIAVVNQLLNHCDFLQVFMREFIEENRPDLYEEYRQAIYKNAYSWCGGGYFSINGKIGDPSSTLGGPIPHNVIDIIEP